MPVPEPSELPQSRRAARAMRDGVERASVPGSTPAIFRSPPPPIEFEIVQEAQLVPSRMRRREPAHHVRTARAARVGVALMLAAASALVVGSASAVTVALAPEPAPIVAEQPAEKHVFDVSIRARETLAGYPGPVASPDAGSSPAVEAVVDPCSDPAVTAALDAGDETGAISAMGGGATFRELVATGIAPCVRLDDPARTWIVVDKLRAYSPIDYRPAELAQPADMRNLAGEVLRQDAAAALSSLAAAARASGAGELGLGSGFRSYETQVATYEGHVARKGLEQADLVSARAGYSEHQSGLAADVVPCADACGTIDDLAASPQGAFVAAHAWEYGWIVRYEDGGTDVTGFLPEPWHLRYIGPDLAKAYHEGGWGSLEEFFGLPAAPAYDH